MNIVSKIENFYYCSSTKRYVNFLRKEGVKIGENFVIHSKIRNILIDLTRPSLIEIGDNVQVNRNFTLLTHDYVTAVFLNLNQEFIPSSGHVKIGNNVAFGFDCTVLKGVSIGDNCFIGAGSIVTKDIPPNSVAVGRPARVLCSIEDYFRRRKMECIEEAKNYGKSIISRFNRLPMKSDFREEFVLFHDPQNEPLDGNIIEKLGPALDYYMHNHKPVFKDFDEFMRYIQGI